MFVCLGEFFLVIFILVCMSMAVIQKIKFDDDKIIDIDDDLPFD